MTKGSDSAEAVAGLNKDFTALTESNVVFSQSQTYKFFTVEAGTGVGGTVLVVAFIITVIQQKLAQQPNWRKPIIDLVMFTFLLACYPFVAGTLMRTVLSFGGLDPGAIAAGGKTLFVQNLTAFADFQNNQIMEDNALVAIMTAGIATILQQILSTAVAASYTFAAAVVFALKILQTTMLKVLWILGPVMIGVAALPFQLTRKFLTSWTMCLIEVGTWGLFSNVLLGLMSNGWTKTNVQALGREGSINFFEHMAFNAVYTLAFAAIPVLAATVIRGGGANGLASAGMAAAGAVAGKVGAASRALEGDKRGGGKGGGGKGGGGGGGGGGDEGGGGGGGDEGGGGGGGDEGGGAPAASAADARRDHFARKGALEKQERERE